MFLCCIFVECCGLCYGVRQVEQVESCMGYVCRPAEITCVDNWSSTCLTHCVMLHPSGHNNWCYLCPKGRRKQSCAHNQPSLCPHLPRAHGDLLRRPLWMLHPRVTVTTANNAGGSRACTHNQPFRDPHHPLASDKWERSIPGGVWTYILEHVQ